MAVIPATSEGAPIPETVSVEIITIGDIPDFSIEKMSECTPEEIPDGLPFHYTGEKGTYYFDLEN